MKKLFFFIKKIYNIPLSVLIIFFYKNFLIFFNRIKFLLFSSYSSNKKNKIYYYNTLCLPIVDFSFVDKIKMHKFYLLGAENKFDYFINNESDNVVRNLKELVNRSNCKHSQKIIFFLKKYNSEYIFIDWTKDFKSDFRWDSRVYYKDIKLDSKDVKFPLELSRFQHLFQLSLAGDIKEVISQILDFIAFQPPYFGPCWFFAMDVGIRAANWSLAISILKNTGFEIDSKEIKKILSSSLYDHLNFVFNNLEKVVKVTNHYLADVAAGFILSLFINKKNKKKFFLRELKNEIKKQFYDDGTNFEASTCYHRLCLELVFYPCFFGVINDESFVGDNFVQIGEKIFGIEYIKALYQIFDSFLYLIKPNELMPQIGDNDSGQFIKLYPRDVLDMRYILAIGSVFFKESKWKIREFFKEENDLAEVKILFGDYGVKIWKALEWNEIKNVKSKVFYDSGWFVIRNNLDYAIISCGPNGQDGKGGHAHNDKLSFELFLGEDKIVDPGSYLYTSNKIERNKFRSTAFHNTVRIDNNEQNDIDENQLFYLIDNSMAKCIKFEETNNKIIFTGEHYGYQSLIDAVAHRRTFIYYKKERKIGIIDEFIGTGIHLFEWNFNVLNNIKLESRDIQFDYIPGEYSKEYGVKEKIKKIYGKLEIKLPFKSEIIISI